MQTQTIRLPVPGGHLDIDPSTGAIAAIHLDEPDTDFVRKPSGSGLLRVAAPLAHFGSHYLETGHGLRPGITNVDDGVDLHYRALASSEGEFPIDVLLRLRSSPDGLVMSAKVTNGWDQPLPQIIFPQLMDLEALGDTDGARVQLGRYKMKPFQQLTMRPDDARWLDNPLHEYIPYADFKFNMKWLDYGTEQQGITLYSRNTRHTGQGLIVQRGDRSLDQVNLRWSHYPLLESGHTWESGEYVLYPHAGDWYAGARAYKKFADEHYPYHAPQRIREALAIRSMWAAVRNAPPTIHLSQLPEYAEEIADPELGITELVLWHWWFRNGYPIFVDPRLGTEEDLERALLTCEEMGVPVVLFVSHHILRTTDETNPEWVHLDPALQPVSNNWTYGRDFLPLFRLPFSGTHSMVNGSALSPSWRETGLKSYEHFLELGAKGICFDVGRAWDQPNYNPAIDGRPDEEGEKMIQFAREARALIHAANPDGTYSAEHVADVNVPVLDYTWEWFNSSDIVDAAPFRYVFPQFRLNANVNEHPRGALIGFMEGALLNIIPGNMHSFRLSDCPELMTMLKRLNCLRRMFLPYFIDGQYRFREGLQVQGGDARLYTNNDGILVIAINPTDEAAEVTLSVDPTSWGTEIRTGTVIATDIGGQEIDRITGVQSRFERTIHLEPDTSCIYEFRPEE